jgi:3-deoxy-D-manno-octulosonic-acid transferase
MIWIYRVLAPLLFVFALPYYLHRMWKRGGYDGSTSQRMGRKLNPPPRQSGKIRIWVQAVSVGELGGIEPLLRELAKYGCYEFILTTTTSTGQALARKRMADLCSWIGWFPLDFLPSARSFWRQMEPDAVLLMESELWPEHLRQAEKRGVPVYLINARLSDRSFQRYLKFRAPAQSLALRHVRLILASSSRDAERWRKLSPASRIVETGNLKLHRTAVEESLRLAKRGKLLREFGTGQSSPSNESPLVLFGNSTWPGEEEMLLNVHERVNSAGKNLLLVIVPRHAERRTELRELMRASGVTAHFRSDGAQAPEGTSVYVADTTGELYALLHAADVVFIGKSLPPNTGGQNPIEAVSLGLPVVFGPDLSNFHDIAQSLIQNGAAHSAQDTPGCVSILLELLNNAGKRGDSARAARQWIASQGDALAKTTSALRAELREPARLRQEESACPESQTAG